MSSSLSTGLFSPECKFPVVEVVSRGTALPPSTAADLGKSPAECSAADPKSLGSLSMAMITF